MHIETSEISDVLYFKEYIPRVIEYAIMSISSTTEKIKICTEIQKRSFRKFS